MKTIIIVILSVILISCESNSISNNAPYRQCSGFIITGQNVQPCYQEGIFNGRCQQHK